jgi:hypothetical protein
VGLLCSGAPKTMLPAQFAKLAAKVLLLLMCRRDRGYAC